MSDEVTMDTGLPEGTGTPEGGQPAAEPQSFINADGTLKEGWQDAYIPDDFKNRPCYKAIPADIKGIMRHIGNQDIAISKQGKGIFVPGPDATPSEVQEFHRQLGVPDSPDKYEFVPPKELEHLYSDSELLNEAKRVMHKAGATPAVFKAMMELDVMRAAQSQKEMQENPLPYYEEILQHAQPLLKAKAESELKAKWGENYESRLQLANLAIAETVTDENEKAALLDRIGNDPLIADFLASVQLRHHTESKGIDTSIGTGVDKRSVDQRIADIASQLTPELRRNNREKYDALLEERSRLYSTRYPEPNAGM